MSSTNSTAKTCTRCLEVKQLTEFSPHPRGLHGTQSRCKPCLAQLRRERRASELDVARDKERKYKAEQRARDAEYFREYQRKYRDANREATRQRNRDWYAANKSKVEKINRAWRQRNVERLREYYRQYRKDNAEAARQRSREWYSRNPEKVYEKSAAERAMRAKATPQWVDRKALLEIYTAAKALRHAGEDVHVDHIVPINNPTVCGLHVPWNLQILPASENIQKSNKLESA